MKNQVVAVLLILLTFALVYYSNWKMTSIGLGKALGKDLGF